MKKIKTLVNITLLSFIVFATNNLYAQENLDCKYVWKLSAEGFHVGESIDIVKKIDKNIQVTSDFNPSGFLQFMGAPKIKRTVYFQNKKIYKREEVRYLKDRIKEEVIWNVNDNIYTRFINKKEDVRVEWGQLQVVDSLSFLYMFEYKLVESDDESFKAGILSKGAPYEANFVFEKNKENKIYNFIGSSNFGKLWLRNDNSPYKFIYQDQGKEMIGELVEKKCN